jgi:hypothetical protein
MVSRRLQIVISHRPAPGDLVAAPHPGFWRRFKLLLAGLAITVIAVAILALALVLGSIMAAVVWIVLLVVIVAFIIRATLQRPHQ